MITKLLLSFLVGGIICAAAQILIDKTSLTPAKILVVYVVFGVFLGGIGFYEPILNAVGAGISLPLIGFGGGLAKGVKEAVDEFGVLGILKGPLTAMSAGVTLALFLGFVFSLISKSRSKRL